MKKLKNLDEINWTFISNLIALMSFFIISITLIILRAMGIIGISWLWVLLPLGIPIGISLLLILVLIIFFVYDLKKNGDFMNFFSEDKNDN
jgi:hypothetical protein